MSDFDGILKKFPPVDFAFAYGSAIFPQDGYEGVEKKDIMYDFIYAVEKPEEWHLKNLERNSNHYATLMRVAGSKWVAHLQDEYGASIYFNTLIQLDDGKMVKYGVISIRNLIDDLQNWNTLYVSGRLQKPVKILQPHADIEKANQTNLVNALRASLLLLPEAFTEDQLFNTITSISYTGDVRMGVAENPNKVQNIVAKNKEKFRELYIPFLNQMKHIVDFDANTKLFKQDISPKTTTDLLKDLPSTAQRYIRDFYEKQYGNKYQAGEVIHKDKASKLVSHAINKIVGRSSTTQTAKGLLTAGFRKSLDYTLRKVMKKLAAIR